MDPDVSDPLPEPQPYDPVDRSSGAVAGEGRKRKRKRCPAGAAAGPALRDMRSGSGGEPSGGGDGKEELERGKWTERMRIKIKVTDQSKTAHVPASKLVVAHTPNIPRSYNALIKTISFLLPHDKKGKSYECASSQKDLFMRWSRSDVCLFLEWEEEHEKMICWMHHICKGLRIKFIVNPAFARRMDEIKVKRCACAFSSNFVGGSESWKHVKDMLLTMFGSLEEEDLEDGDHLFAFTRVGEYVCFRDYKINSVPEIDDSYSMLSLTETGSHFCLKLVDVQGRLNTSNLDSDMSENLIDKNLKFSPILCYTIPSDQSGSCISHVVLLSGQSYSVFLPNPSYISSVESLEGFTVTLADLIEKEPFLKIKPIIGSATNKECVFIRSKIKAVLRSLVLEFLELLKSGKCVDSKVEIDMSNVLIRGSCVRLYGLELTGYNEDLAKKNIGELEIVIRECFPQKLIPIDLKDSLERLRKDPLNTIEELKDDCVLLKAQERRTLLINLHSEYKTNVDIKDDKKSDPTGDPLDAVSFFDDCPYKGEDWRQTIKDNEYMRQVANWDEDDSSEENDTVGDKEGDTARQVMGGRIKKKLQASQRSKTIRKRKRKLAQETNKGKLQFDFMRNFEMHMPEKANKDRLVPFRLGLADYMLTAYFPRYLPFVQKRTSLVLKSRKSKKQTQNESGRRLCNN